MMHLYQACYLDFANKSLSNAASFAVKVKTLSTFFRLLKVDRRSSDDYTTLPEEWKSNCFDHFRDEERRYAKRRWCPAHGRELVGKLCLVVHSRLIMAAAGGWAALPAVSGTAVDPNIARGGFVQSLACDPMQSAFGGGAVWE